MVGIRNVEFSAKKLVLGLDKSASLVYNISMRNTTKDNKMSKVYKIITSVKLDPKSKAYKKAIAKSKGMLTGSPDIYQTTGKFVDKISK
jgi:hypothetical protein